ncbi:PilZ domain-containing protein [Anaerobranca gottschalkii]|uniref:PilZ domain-containing protein n=1 Tax=Anaerobranca gottschalkii DSM 13577 TaxID=1120990 RepID=A0A1H9ZD08_9FIRM|nr:PilZ domain-containing protein [Anaerobranca gottschalkii]SES79215.1 PilZ domain-containing protein [Anaerobranca gottschalkii DSM 13577]
MEKRNFYRFQMSKEIEFSILDPDTVEVVSNPYKGILRDLSGGGLCFTTDISLQRDTLLEIRFFDDDKLFVLIGKVLRIMEIDNSRVYAVEFMYLDRNTQDQLVQLIFKLESRWKK